MEAALGEVVQVPLHVVAQVVEAQLIVGGVGDVAGIGIPPLLVVQAVLHHTHAETQPGVEASHPLRIAAGQVVVHGDQVGTLARQGVQVQGQRGREGLALTGAHLRHPALVQGHATHQLHIEVAHLQDTAAAFPGHGEGLGQDVVDGGPSGQLGAQVGSLGLQGLVAEGLHLGLKSVDGADLGPQPLQLPIVLGADEFLEDVFEHEPSSRGNHCG